MNSSNFRLPDSFYDPPTFWFWCCTECEWVDEESTTIKSELHHVDQCPECGCEVYIENG